LFLFLTQRGQFHFTLAFGFSIALCLDLFDVLGKAKSEVEVAEIRAEAVAGRRTVRKWYLFRARMRARGWAGCVV